MKASWLAIQFCSETLPKAVSVLIQMQQQVWRQSAPYNIQKTTDCSTKSLIFENKKMDMLLFFIDTELP